MYYIIKDLWDRGLTFNQIKRAIDELLCERGMSMTATDAIMEAKMYTEHLERQYINNNDVYNSADRTSIEDTY